MRVVFAHALRFLHFLHSHAFTCITTALQLRSLIAFRCICIFCILRVFAFRCIICCIMCIRGMTAYLLQFMRARTLGKCTTQTPPPSPQVPPRLLPAPLPSPLPTPSASPPPLLLPRGMTAYLLQFEGKNLVWTSQQAPWYGRHYLFGGLGAHAMEAVCQ